MLVLAIDCGQKFCSAALYDAAAERLLASDSPEIGRGHAELLPGIVGRTLEEAGVDLAELGLLGVTIGPGSFAGIRVGVAFARGLALSLSVPAVGVSSLLAMAMPEAARVSRPVMAAIDARRDRVWCAVAAPDGTFLSCPAERTPAEAAALALRAAASIVGDAGELLLAAEPALPRTALGPAVRAPDIGEVARLAARFEPAEHPAEPVYLRAADAKPQIGFAVERTA